MGLEVITLKDIAKSLGFSVSTVSKALRDSHEISEKTKKTVLAYAHAHNYRANPIAQSLKNGQSKSIGIVVSTIDNNFFSQVFGGIESVAYDKGYNVIITQTHESYDREVMHVRDLTLRAIDGLLISLSTETKDVEHLKILHNQGFPIVLFDRVSDEIDTHKVIADNFKGAYDATIHLIESGYKRIAHITSSATTSITSERLAGYLKALEDRGIPRNDAFIKYCAHGGKDLNEIEDALQSLMHMENGPDAIFTASDRITTTTLTLLNKLKVRIPEDVALLGFTNTILAGVLNPPLTSVYQPAFDIGKNAMEMLIRLIESKTPVTEFETRVFAPELFKRKSSEPRPSPPTP